MLDFYLCLVIILCHIVPLALAIAIIVSYLKNDKDKKEFFEKDEFLKYLDEKRLSREDIEKHIEYLDYNFFYIDDILDYLCNED